MWTDGTNYAIVHSLRREDHKMGHAPLKWGSRTMADQIRPWSGNDHDT
jgi:hypothetical protein